MNKYFKFRDLLAHYCVRLMTAKRRLEHNLDDKKTFKSLKYNNLYWFHYIRDSIFDEKEYVKQIKEKRQLNRKKYLLPEDKRCPGCEDGKPYMLLKYRGVIIPVYDDNYGQQDFAIIGGREVSGGCYNLESLKEFINEVDYILEDLFIHDQYDLYKEVSELYPEQEQ